MKNAFILCLAAAAVSGACITSSAFALIDQDTRVLVIGENSGLSSSDKNAALYRTVGQSLYAWLDKNGYQVLRARSSNATQKSITHHLTSRQIINAVQSMNHGNVDAMVVYQVRHKIKRQRDGYRNINVELTAKLVNLPNGKIIDTVSISGVEQPPLPYECNIRCRQRHAYEVVEQIAPNFAESTVTQLMQTNWRSERLGIKNDRSNWKKTDEGPAKIYGYSVLLKDFHPTEIKRIMRVFHRHADRVDVWTVRETRDTRTLWIEAEERPTKIRKALRKLLKAIGLEAQIKRTERGFTVIRENRNASHDFPHSLTQSNS